MLEEPARVRLQEFEEDSFEIEIFAYVDESDWNSYLALREEILLNIADAVEAAGTHPAVPAQTMCLAHGQESKTS